MCIIEEQSMESSNTLIGGPIVTSTHLEPMESQQGRREDCLIGGVYRTANHNALMPLAEVVCSDSLVNNLSHTGATRDS